MTDCIKIEHLTKDFGEGRGIFDVNLTIKKGEVFGLVGINGSGKSTIMRHLMGFLKAQKGSAVVNGKDCWDKAAELKKSIGYIPGEITFPDLSSGTEFFKLQAEYMGLKDMSYAHELVDALDLDPTAKLKRMSKGMKQKTAIVNAFMSDPDILLLDEATTGLDPLMQKSFTDLILREKKKAKTIFMSSHMFEEMEATCDRVAFLKNGKIIHVLDMKTILGNEEMKQYKIEFIDEADYLDFLGLGFDIIRKQENYKQVTIRIPDEAINLLFKALSSKNVRFMTHIPYTLEACFKEIYNTIDTEVN